MRQALTAIEIPWLICPVAT